MIFDVCSILLGTTPENFYAHFAGASSRKTRWYKVKKGVFGNSLAFIGVVEDHAKGTLHYHILVFGGITPYALQRFVYIKKLNELLAECLDSMYQSELPTEIHVHNIIRKILQENTELGRLARDQLEPLVRAKLVARREPLFERTEPLAVGQTVGEAVTLDDVKKEVQLQCVQQEDHLHLKRCHAGFSGTKGCSLCMPHGCCPKTQAVKLEANVPDEKPSAEEADFPHDSDGSSDEHPARTREEEDFGARPEGIHHSDDAFDDGFQEKATSYKPDPEPIVPVDEDKDGADQWYKYSMQHIYERNYDNSAIVWEIGCPRPEGIKGSNGERSKYTREELSDDLASHLQDFPTHCKGSKFWEWVVNLDDVNFFVLYDRILQDLIEANGYLAAFSPTISYCTGSHNNCQMLGGIVQAKGAIMYICPYMGKQKYPLQNCLTILHDALQHVKKHPTVLEGERGLPSQTTKQVLQRVLNQLNLKMESSEYQVVAALLDLPSIVCSDQFIYGNPVADEYFRKFVRGESGGGSGPPMNSALFLQQLNLEDGGPIRPDANRGAAQEAPDPSDNPGAAAAENSRATDGDRDPRIDELLDPTVIRQLGQMRIFSMEETGPSGEKLVRKTMVPKAALYDERGTQPNLGPQHNLELLSRMEMRALVAIKKRSEDPSKSQVCEYNFAEGFAVGCQYTQYPSAKHRTPILTSKPPPHPGKEPANTNTMDYRQWKERADRYASYFLTEYRPEPGNPLSYGYTWKDLVDYLTTLENDQAALSKFRLMAMHTRMRGFFTEHRVKVMLADYRSRNQYMWDANDRRKHATEDWYRQQEEHYDRSHIDEELYSQKFNRLSARSRSTADHMIHFNAEQQKAFLVTQPNPNHVYVQRRVRRTGLQPFDPKFSTAAQNLRSVKLKKATDPNGSGTTGGKPVPAVARTVQWNAIQGELKEQQKEFFQVYRKYVENPHDPDCQPPDVSLLHGAAGTGKSKLIKATIKACRVAEGDSIRTAFNNINALDLAGVTTASLVTLRMPLHMHGYTNMTQERLQELSEEFKKALLVVVDELANQAPFHIAQLNWVAQQATGVYDKPFGGIPAILAGDLTQILPIKAGHGLTDAIVDQLEYEFQWRPRKRRKRKPTAAPVADSEGTTIRDEDRFLSTHPHGKGLELLQQARWFELTEQIRSADSVHTHFVVRLYRQEAITLQDLQQYKILSSEDFEGNNPWYDAPFIVATNRERYSMIHEAAVRYARAHGTIVIRWPARHTHWMQKPDPEFLLDALEDPCFYEYFVVMASGYLSDLGINKGLGLVNALPFKYHSFTVRPEDQESVDAQIAAAVPGDVVTLPAAPATVNIQIDPEDGAQSLTERQLAELRLIKGERD